MFDRFWGAPHSHRGSSFIDLENRLPFRSGLPHLILPPLYSWWNRRPSEDWLTFEWVFGLGLSELEVELVPFTDSSWKEGVLVLGSLALDEWVILNPSSYQDIPFTNRSQEASGKVTLTFTVTSPLMVCLGTMISAMDTKDRVQTNLSCTVNLCNV